jgi:carbamoylphosphate synthase large subunit
MTRTKIAITGAGGGGANNLISTIRDRDAYLLIGLDMDPLKAGRANVDRRYVVPSAGSRDYLARLNEVLEWEQPALIIPTNDAEVAALSRLRDEIKVPLFFPDQATVETCLNKWRFYEFAIRNGVRTAKTFRVTCLDEIEDIFAHFNEFPLWCRIIFGAGSKGATKVLDP